MHSFMRDLKTHAHMWFSLINMNNSEVFLKYTGLISADIFQHRSHDFRICLTFLNSGLQLQI